jgi:argininosuccinate synthase
MRDIEAFLENSSAKCNRRCICSINAISFSNYGIESKYDLMSSKFGKYGEMNTGFTGDDVRGFQKYSATKLSIWNAVQKEMRNKCSMLNNQCSIFMMSKCK